MISVAVALYTVGVALASLDQLLGWLGTLLSTVLSVFCALVIGLALFRYQIRETDRKRREDLAALLETELGELRRGLPGSTTFVPDEVLEDLRPSASHEIRLSIHHPLVVEEAARSGLFGAEPTAAMLVLARDMRAHDRFFLREATSLRPHMETGRGPTGFTARPTLRTRSSSGCTGDTRRRPGWCDPRRRASSRAARWCSKGPIEEAREPGQRSGGR